MDPIFGQINAAQSHLENNNVKEGDLFLFFGWFRKQDIIKEGYLLIQKIRTST